MDEYYYSLVKSKVTQISQKCSQGIATNRNSTTYVELHNP